MTYPRRVHFVGVGGAGMSAVAKVMLERGHKVSGSDLKTSAPAVMLEAMGAAISVGHDPALVEGADLVVFSAAIPPNNAELRRAAELGIRTMKRGEALAEILQDGRSVVVSGTHGKTTTTSMIVSVIRRSGLDPTYLVGGGLNDVGTNAKSGRDELAIAESDESDGSFLLLSPHIAVVTNVEPDHLDHWRSLDDLKKAFRRFFERVDPQGSIVVPAADEDLVAAARRTHREVVTFGDGGDVSARALDLAADGSSVAISARGESTDVRLRVPGRHNVENAMAAAAACLQTGCSLDAVAAGLTAFAGVQRRFEVCGFVSGVTVIDDYAHHPSEVRAALATARLGPYRRVIAVFQPHLFSRTMALQHDFGGAFGDADRVVITDVYGAREQPVPGVSGKLIADAVCARLPGRAVAYFPHRDELISYLVASARPGDAVLTLGAGDITSLGEEFLALFGAAA